MRISEDFHAVRGSKGKLYQIFQFLPSKKGLQKEENSIGNTVEETLLLI